MSFLFGSSSLQLLPRGKPLPAEAAPVRNVLRGCVLGQGVQAQFLGGGVATAADLAQVRLQVAAEVLVEQPLDAEAPVALVARQRAQLVHAVPVPGKLRRDSQGWGKS